MFVGHYENLEAVLRLTQSPLMRGLIRVIFEGGQLMPRLPVSIIKGPSALYNRQVNRDPAAGAQFVGIREKLDWTAREYTERYEARITRVARQDALDHFVSQNYNNIEDYEAHMMMNLALDGTRFIEHNLIYGAIARSDLEFDGLHQLVLDADTGSGLNVDNAEAGLNLQSMRKLVDACKARADQKGTAGMFWLFPEEIARRLSAAYYDKGIDTGSQNVRAILAQVNIGSTELGASIMYFQGIPIVISDYLQPEQANSGATKNNVRQLHSSGTQNFSVFLCRPGPILDGGLTFTMGSQSAMMGDVFKVIKFDELEDYDSGGIRIVAYCGTALGSQLSLGRIFDITDADVSA